jgi:hypothetical protein
MLKKWLEIHFWPNLNQTRGQILNNHKFPFNQKEFPLSAVGWPQPRYLKSKVTHFKNCLLKLREKTPTVLKSDIKQKSQSEKIASLLYKMGKMFDVFEWLDGLLQAAKVRDLPQTCKNSFNAWALAGKGKSPSAVKAVFRVQNPPHTH